MSLTQKQVSEYRELARLIRIGAKLRPQGKGYLFSNGKSCALGALYEAACGTPKRVDEILSFYDVKWTDSVADKYPSLTPSFGNNLLDKIYSMNDRGQTREQIADWLDAQASEAEIRGEAATTAEGRQPVSAPEREYAGLSEGQPSPRPTFAKHLEAWNSGKVLVEVS